MGDRFHPIGLSNTGSASFPWPDIDIDIDDDLAPSVADALVVRSDRATLVRDCLASLAVTDLTRSIEVLENGENPLLECVYAVFEEAFWHNRYALRDLAQRERTRARRAP